MADSTEFEIELFNPLQETIMAKIFLNGKTEKDGIVLYPGQRIFLERYLDSNKKFKFITYKVEADNDIDVENAIASNGLVKVEFYREKVFTLNTTISFHNPYVYSTPTIYDNPIFGGTVLTSSSCLYSSPVTFSANSVSEPTEKEVGLIGKGQSSKQEFSNVYNDFYYFPFETIQIKILPDSQKLVEADDLKFKKYCSNCGKKVKHNDKFCSYCGNKL